MNLLKSARDIVHVLLRSEEEALFEPETLFVADQIAVWTEHFGVIQPGGSFRQKWAKCLVSEHRLVMEGKAISGRARDALSLEGLDDREARSTEVLLLNPKHEQVVTVPCAST